jgi:hypothetical protein
MTKPVIMRASIMRLDALRPVRLVIMQASIVRLDASTPCGPCAS